MSTHTPMRIMVVDDDAVMVHLLRATIEDGFGTEVCVEAVADPHYASARLEAGVVDLLVTDLMMPGIDGLKLLRCAKRRNAWTQVVVLTGHFGCNALTEAMELGANDYLVKPLDTAELEEVIRGVHRRLRRWRRALASTLSHGQTCGGPETRGVSGASERK
jgi:DNA-binding response OmpR family regulator